MSEPKDTRAAPPSPAAAAAGTPGEDAEAETHRPLGVGATFATASQVATAIAGGVMGIVVARLLEPEGIGAFTVVQSSLLLLAAVSMLGIGVGSAYRISTRSWRPEDALPQLQLAAFVLGTFGAVLGLGIAAITQGSAFKHIPLGTVALGLASLPFALSWLYSSYLALALDRYETYALAPATQAVCGLVFVAALTPPFGLTGAVAGLAAANLLTGLFISGWTARAVGRARERWFSRSSTELREAAKFGFRADLTNTLQLLNERADLFIVNAFAARATVGNYAVALSVTSLGTLLPRALAGVVFPRVARLDASAAGETQEMVIVKSVRHTVLIVGLTSVVLLAGLLLIPLIYGSRFRPAIELGLILLPGVAALGLGQVLAATVVGKGYPQYSLYTALIVTPPTLGLYLLFAPTLGASGVALASSLSYAGTALLASFFFRRVTEMRDVSSLLPGAEEIADYRRLLRPMIDRIRGRRG